jgi:hypothetical protein
MDDSTVFQEFPPAAAAAAASTAAAAVTVLAEILKVSATETWYSTFNEKLTFETFHPAISMLERGAPPP